MHITKQTTDVLVIGGALSGLMAALSARNHTPHVLIVSKAPVGKGGNTLISAGMIAAAVGEQDSPELFFENLLASGKGLIDKQLAHKLAFKSPEIFYKMIELGIQFMQQDGKIKINLSPGHGVARNIQAVIPGVPVQNAGLAYMLPLLRACQERNISIQDGYTLVKLIKQGERVSGALFKSNQDEYLQVTAKSIIIATGGYSKLFGVTNNTADITADGIGAALTAGCTLQDMEQVQFFPCMMFKPLKLIPNNILFGLGARLKNNLGEYFMTNYDSAGDMATRDIMSRSIYYEVQAGRGSVDDSVYFDCTPINHQSWQHDFAALYKLFLKSGIDLTKQTFPVKPCAHYSLGGIMTDAECRSSIPGLYVAGEAMSSVHGANRLAGAGLLEAAVFGFESGQSAALDSKDIALAPTAELSDAVFNKPEPELMAKLGQIMWSGCSLIRSADTLNTALSELQVLAKQTNSYQLSEKITLCQAVIQAALLRTESRGAHYRLDFPESDPTQAKHIISKITDGQLSTTFKSI